MRRLFRSPSKKRAKSKQLPEELETKEPLTKKAKKAINPDAKFFQFFQRSVVRGKIVKVKYFQEQGLEVFLDKLRAQGWLELFANTQLGCSVLDLVKFYANCNITNVVVTTEVNKKKTEIQCQRSECNFGCSC